MGLRREGRVIVNLTCRCWRLFHQASFAESMNGGYLAICMLASWFAKRMNKKKRVYVDRNVDVGGGGYRPDIITRSSSLRIHGRMNECIQSVIRLLCFLFIGYPMPPPPPLLMMNTPNSALHKKISSEVKKHQHHRIKRRKWCDFTGVAMEGKMPLFPPEGLRLTTKMASRISTLKWR